MVLSDVLISWLARGAPDLIEWVPFIVVRMEWIREISEGWRVLPQPRIPIAGIPGKYFGGGGGSGSGSILLDFHGSNFGSGSVLLDLFSSSGSRRGADDFSHGFFFGEDYVKAL